MLENTKDRDIDQVVSRWCRTVKAETRHNILMVDQLWLWNVNPSTRVAENADSKTSTPKIENHDPVADREYLDRYVISCFPNRTGTGHLFHRSLDDLRRLVLNLDHRKRVRIRTPEDLVSRILETCCGVFDRMQDAEMLRFFQMFEDSIGSIVSAVLVSYNPLLTLRRTIKRVGYSETSSGGLRAFWSSARSTSSTMKRRTRF